MGPRRDLERYRFRTAVETTIDADGVDVVSY